MTTAPSVECWGTNTFNNETVDEEFKDRDKDQVYWDPTYDDM